MAEGTSQVTDVSLCGMSNGLTWPGENSTDRRLPKSSCQTETDDSLHADTGTPEVVDSLNINNLPAELLLEIFSYINCTEDLKALQKVCTRWRSLAQDAALWYGSKYVLSQYQPEEKVIKDLRETPHIRTVILNRTVSPAVFHELSRNCHYLSTLYISPVQTAGCKAVKELLGASKRLHTLKISYELLDDIKFNEAGQWIKNLQILYLETGVSIDCDCTVNLRCLADNYPHLCGVDFCSVNYRMHDMEYFIKAKKHMLKGLGVPWSSNENRLIFPLLTLCADSLECLKLYEWINDDLDQEVFNAAGGGAEKGFAVLGQLHNLRELRLEDAPEFILTPLIPLLFKNGDLSKLQTLCFSHINFEDETINIISDACPDLRKLAVEHCCNHTENALAPLKKLIRLERLEIRYCNIFCGDELQNIARLPALHTLIYRRIKFKSLSPGIGHILKMSKLRTLGLQDCVCWCIPFARFPGRLVSLRELYIDGCTGDNSAIEKMSVQMPELEVNGMLRK